MAGITDLTLLSGPQGGFVRRTFAYFTLVFTSILLAAALLCSSAMAIPLGLSTSSTGDTYGSGATLLRLEMRPTQPFESYDAVFEQAAQQNMTVLPLMLGRLDGTNGLPRSGEQAAWTEWAKQAVRRYGYNGVFWSTHPNVPAHPVGAWEMWNEPNNNSFWSFSATEYGSFLAWAGPAIQQASESWGGQRTGVLFGGLLAWSGGTGYQTFLANAYKVPGASSAFTGLAFHPYELDPSQFPGRTRLQVFQEAVSGARGYLNSLGATGKSLWITETGWPTEDESDVVQYGVSEAEQANLLKSAASWSNANAAGLQLKAFIWYYARDLSPQPIWQERTGLLNQYALRRTAWFAFQEAAGAPEWPTPAWNNENLGGNVPSDPDISSRGLGVVNVFARGTDDHLYFRSWNGATHWSSWQQVPGPTIASSPSSVSWGPNRVDVVARLADGSVEHWSDVSGVWNYENLGGNTASAPEISSRGKEIVDVWARGTDNGLYHKSWDTTYHWSGWEKIPGPTIAGGPGAASWGPNRVDVVARLADGSIEHWSWDSGTWNYENLGGDTPSDPDISARAFQVVDIFARGTNDVLHHTSWDPVYHWTGWEQIPGPTIDSGVSCASWSPNRIDVVARVPGGSVQHWSWDR